jgi:hypothetical protein
MQRRKPSTIIFIIIFLITAFSTNGCNQFFKKCLQNSDCNEGLLCKKDDDGTGICIYTNRHRIQNISGVQDCSEKIKGTNGIITLRLFMSDSNNNSIFSGLGGSFSTNDLEIETGDILKPKVIDGITGEIVKDAKVELNFQDIEIKKIENPNFAKAKKSSNNRRVPNAVSLLLDMSETAANQDNALARTSATAGWILDEEFFNSDLRIGNLDLFQASFIRRNTISNDDDIFANYKDKQGKVINFVYGDKKVSSFLPTNEDNKDIISSKFTNTSNSRAGGSPPIFSSIANTAKKLHEIFLKEGKIKINPAIINIILERDTNLIENKKTKINDALSAVKQKTGFIPVTSIIYPKPNNTSKEQWTQYIDQLCQISMQGQNTYSGNIFHIIPENRIRKDRYQDYQSQTRSALNMSFYSLKGFFETKIQYNLTGVKKEHNYFIEFSINLKNHKKSDAKRVITLKINT